MNGKSLRSVLEQAMHEGLLPPGTTAPPQDSRPWPVLLLVALGAWLAALPLLAAVGLLLGDFVQRGVGPYVAGSLLLAGAMVVLRSRSLPVFVEQLALPVLLVGGGALGTGLFRDLPQSAAAAALSALALAVAALVPRPWLRVLLGTAAAVLFGLACLPRRWDLLSVGSQARQWWALHLMLAAWAVAGALQARARALTRSALESLRAGWLLATLAGLAAGAGMTMFVGASLGAGVAGEVARMPWRLWQADSLPMQAVSMLLAVTGAAWAARAWPALRQGWCAAAAGVLGLLAACMPALGAPLLALAVVATAARWRLATAAAFTAAWIVGTFYYSLTWPLQLKAGVLLAAGAGLGGLAWWALRPQRAARRDAAVPAVAPRRARLGLALSVAAVLLVANTGIWQKESLIAHGQVLLVELVPVDPRSLMQGDYMQLRFGLPDVDQGPDQAQGLLQVQRPRVLALRDERGVARFRAAPPGTQPLPGEVAIELTPKGGRWVLVTDAWFFAEGEAARWAPARYGEFRVDSDGRALLVGLRGAQLEAL
jgi:uncharacterized membrane-anchored protein